MPRRVGRGGEDYIEDDLIVPLPAPLERGLLLQVASVSTAPSDLTPPSQAPGLAARAEREPRPSGVTQAAIPNSSNPRNSRIDPCGAVGSPAAL